MQKRAGLVQLTSQAAMAATSLFIAVLASEVGASLTEIGFIVSAYATAQLVSHTMAGRAADQHGRLRMVRLGLGLSVLAALLHAAAWSPLSLAAARVLLGCAAGLYPAALTSLAYDANRKLGRFTSWGSLGFSLGTLSAGLLASAGALGGYSTSVFLLAGALLAVAFGASLTMPRRPEAKVAVPFFPKAVIARNLPVYVALLLRHVGAAAVWAIFPLYMLSLGADLRAVAVASFLNGLAQFAFMQWADRFESGRLVVVGLLMSALALALFAAAPTLTWILATQFVLGAAWAFLYTGCLKFVMERNVERATSTGLLQGTLQLGNVIGPLLGGAVADALGFRPLMVVAAFLSLAAIPAFLYELRRHPSFLEEMLAEHAHALHVQR